MTNIPEGYTQEEWDAYQRDPESSCIKELGNQDSSVRYNAVDILRGLAFDAPNAIVPLASMLATEPDKHVRAHIAFSLSEICLYVAKDARAPAVTALNDLLVSETNEDVLLEARAALDTITAMDDGAFRPSK